MQTRRVTVSFAALAALALTLAWLLRARETQTTREPIGAAEASRPASSGSSTSLDEHSPNASRAPATADTSATQIVSGAKPATHELRGRLLLPDGAAAAGADLLMKAEEFVGAGEWREPAGWPNPRARTDSAGRFTMVLPRLPDASARRDMTFELVLDHPACAILSPHFSDDELDELAVLDDIVLEACGTIEGRFVDTRGKVLPGTSTVAVRPRPYPEFGDVYDLYAEVSSTDGTFRIDRVPAKRATVRVHTDQDIEIAPVEVDVRAGEVTRADFVYDGPDLAQRIRVDVRSDRGWCGRRSTGEIVLRGASGERRMRLNTSASEQFFDDVSPGVYTLSIEDPPYRQPWMRDDVRPGETVHVDLVGNVTIELDVRDARTDEAIGVFDVLVRCDGRLTTGREFAWFEERHDPARRARLEGLVAGTFTLFVRAPGYADTLVTFDDLVPGETRRVTVRLGASAHVEGRVVEADGITPAAGATVVLRDVGIDEFYADTPSFPHILRTTTAADGTFRFRELSNARYRVRASRGQFVRSVDVEVSFASDPARAEVLLVLPAWGSIHGALRVPEGASTTGMWLQIVPRLHDAATSERLRYAAMYSDALKTRIEDDGTFASQPLAPGECAVVLYLPETNASTSRTSYSSGESQHTTLGTVRIELGRDREQDFDLRDVFPGALRVHVAGDAARVRGCVVHMIPRTDRDLGAAFAYTDEAGDARVDPLLPGTYDLGVMARDEEWFFMLPRPVTITATKETTIEVDIALVEGTLVVRDESSMPLVSRRVDVTSHLSNGAEFTREAQTNERGELRLRRPASRMTVGWAAPRYAERLPGVELEWTVSGPVPATVTLPAK